MLIRKLNQTLNQSKFIARPLSGSLYTVHGNELPLPQLNMTPKFGDGRTDRRTNAVCYASKNIIKALYAQKKSCNHRNTILEYNQNLNNKKPKLLNKLIFLTKVVQLYRGLLNMRNASTLSVFLISLTYISAESRILLMEHK